MSSSTTPAVDELLTNWQIKINITDQFRISEKRDVVFSEIGYKSLYTCAQEPWNPTSSIIHLEAQANATQAFFEAFTKNLVLQELSFGNGNPSMKLPLAQIIKITLHKSNPLS